MQISVRLNKDVEHFIKSYSRINGTSMSTSIREILHYFKLIVAMTGINELIKVVNDNIVYENGNGIKVNVTLNKTDIEFIDMISRILKTNRSTALRFCLSSMYYILLYTSVH